MRKTLVLAISGLFLYCLFRDMTLLRALLLGAAIASAYVISRVPSKYLSVAKYPIVGLSFALSPVLIVYPAVRSYAMVAASAIFLAFYSVALFLITLEEKGKQVYKEVLGLSFLYAALFVNLFLTGHSELILPLSISVLLFLFIINKNGIMPFAAGCTVAAVIVLLATGVHLLGAPVWLNGAERYTLLATGFALLLIAFVGFVKRPDFVGLLTFFGLLYVSVDLLMSVGFRVRGVLLHQPLFALLIVGPVIGMAMKGGKERP